MVYCLIKTSRIGNGNCAPVGRQPGLEEQLLTANRRGLDAGVLLGRIANI